MDRYLVLLFGNIASGKSTMSKVLNKHGFVCVSSDALRYMLHPYVYKFDQEEDYAISETEKIAVTTLMSLNKNIVVDDAGNMLFYRREWLVELAKKNCYKLIAITMPFFSREVSVKRRMKHPHGKYSKERWSQVYDMFQKNYNPPTKKEGFDAILSSNSDSLFDVLAVD